ncbi:NUDIX domain-containing protein [Micromonospora echinaurantiaca]|uniref:NUDIX domain-containing protein n=1 Tax=Micromonospora echinaurantiaca TaxID=47857 RepID=UPI00371F888C
MISISAVLLVDRDGRLLLQLRDEHAPNHPNVWGLPGGHGEPGETAEQAAARELREETGLRAEHGLCLFARQELPELGRVKHYFCGATGAGQDDVVLGEGAAILFLPAEEVLDGRPFTPGTAEVLARFLGSPEHARLAALAAAGRAGEAPADGRRGQSSAGG